MAASLVLLQRHLGVVVAAAVGLVVASVWWLGVQTYVTSAIHSALPWGLAPVDS